MNPELEALLKAYDAFREARGDKALRLLAIYEGQLEDAAQRAGMTSALLGKAVSSRYPQWVRAQRKTAAIPPKA